jgi:carbon-monoxide dehydrogenase small subunit
MMQISFVLNGKACDTTIEPRELLIDVLREKFQLTGTKRSCDVQVCGACTVLVDGLPVSSCSTLAAEVDARDVQSIEGLSQHGQLDPIQRAFVEHGAMQCGFCTPGMVLAVKSLLAQDPHPNEETIRHYLRGNICRCTGYVKIIEAINDLASRHG